MSKGFEKVVTEELVSFSVFLRNGSRLTNFRLAFTNVTPQKLLYLKFLVIFWVLLDLTSTFDPVDESTFGCSWFIKYIKAVLQF